MDRAAATEINFLAVLEAGSLRPKLVSGETPSLSLPFPFLCIERGSWCLSYQDASPTASESHPLSSLSLDDLLALSPNTVPLGVRASA